MKAKANNTVRIIGGQYRSRVLHFPDAPGLRPTPDRVRETLFNWLGQRLDGLVCLDAFAGSGALGFEAASRGAARVVMLEQERSAHEALLKNAQTLALSGVEILRRDARSHLATSGDSYDLIFLDPPFASDLLQIILPLAATRLAADGRIYAESPRPLVPEGMTVLRQSRAGQSHFCLLELA
ncbi:MAG: 16S rRNA (guanine(966)-N(2))-methyltransferase RsmD [Pseudomonadota bacterium]|nr:16S rRNA (guanine(966)-N(2))-methyltransferase RsmD [Pseudomonadota bacterium]